MIITHHIPSFTRYQTGLVMAACDRYIHPRDEAPVETMPTCPACLHWLGEIVDNNAVTRVASSSQEVSHGDSNEGAASAGHE